MSSANRAFCLPSPVAKSCTVVGSEKQLYGHFFQQAQAFNKDHGTALIETAPKQNSTSMHCIFHDCCMAEFNERLLKIVHKRHCLVRRMARTGAPCGPRGAREQGGRRRRWCSLLQQKCIVTGCRPRRLANRRIFPLGRIATTVQTHMVRRGF